MDGTGQRLQRGVAGGTRRPGALEPLELRLEFLGPDPGCAWGHRCVN